MTTLIVGLGNPGQQYTKTRHNVGFMVLDELAELLEVKYSANDKLKADLAETNVDGKKVILMKPLTFMNNSGEAVSAVIRKFKVGDAANVWLVSDDASLPFGILRVRLEGSSGGHNGIKSVIDKIGEEDFARFRLGIGEPSEPMALEDWVLSNFSKSEEKELSKMIHAAAQKIKKGLSEGVNSLTENLAE